MAVGYTQAFFDAVCTKVQTSLTLAANLTAGDPADHVVKRRFRRGSESPKHTQLIQEGPMIYAWPGYSQWRPMTPDNERTEATVNLCVVQLSYPDTVLEFTDALVRELMHSSDGAGGAASFLSPFGHNLRVRVETPDEEGNASKPEVRQLVVLTATLHSVV